MELSVVSISEDHEAAGAYDRYYRPGFLHRDLYVSREVFKREMIDLFGSTWVYVAHESEIPAANDFVTRSIGRRPVIVTRGRDGSINVVINRCTHRGALVCREAKGNASRFSCGYHAWTFSPDGSCVGVPLKHAYGEDFDLSELDLRVAAKMESYRGFIFASMSEDVPPLVEHLAHARRFLDEWLDRGDNLPLVVRSGEMQFKTHANWKTVYDNAGDGYHPPFSHDSMLRVFSKRYGDVDFQYFRANFDETPMVSRDLGNGHTMLDQRPMMHAESAWERQHVMPGREVIWDRLSERYGAQKAREMLDASTGAGMNINIFPNLLLLGNQIQLIEPISVDLTVVRWFSTTLEGAPDEVNAIRMRMQEDFPSFGEVDDNAQFEACQAGMENVPEMEWIDVRRHMATDRKYVDHTGILTDAASSEMHLRTYHDAWRRIMNRAANRAAAEQR